MSTHINERNQASMVDVSSKNESVRTAIAESIVTFDGRVIALFENGELHSKKGPVFHTAILAGIMGAKETSRLIPLCHPIPLEDCKITIDLVEKQAVIRCVARTTAKTGVEMEALTGASIAALTLYDMCKSIDPAIVISTTRLVEKTGGKSDYTLAPYV
jgi:cyclic pyranopterin monophosphate synthase